jgi:pimeloyl-ACP methyl ester carboxylesterase
MAEALARERRLILLDARGVGGSGAPPEPCTTALLAADALALLDHLGLGPVDARLWREQPFYDSPALADLLDPLLNDPPAIRTDQQSG